LETSDP